MKIQVNAAIRLHAVRLNSSASYKYIASLGLSIDRKPVFSADGTIQFELQDEAEMAKAKLTEHFGKPINKDRPDGILRIFWKVPGGRHRTIGLVVLKNGTCRIVLFDMDASGAAPRQKPQGTDYF
jgi:hypothetical protein